MKYKLSELIAKFGGALHGNDVEISNIMPLDNAKLGDITFLSDNRFVKDLPSCKASAIILKNENVGKVAISAIITDNPLLYSSFVSRLFNPRQQLPYGIKQSCVIDESVVIGNNHAISDNVVIGKNVKLGSGVQIYPNVVIGNDVVIGDNVVIYPNVTIYSKVIVGSDCAFHSGVVIGADGFGYAPDDKKQRHKIPQIGGVIIGNNVEIGANTTVDCGTYTPTIIEDHVIIDNLVQIAHNCTIGAHTVIVGQAGVGGSSVIGKYCILAAGAAISDHINICDHTVIGGLTGIGKDIVTPDLYMATYPFSKYRDYAKNAIHIRHLNEMHQRIKALESQIKQFIGEKQC